MSFSKDIFIYILTNLYVNRDLTAFIYVKHLFVGLFLRKHLMAKRDELSSQKRFIIEVWQGPKHTPKRAFVDLLSLLFIAEATTGDLLGKRYP